VGFTIATHPVTGMTISTISENEMIMGMGQHGEAGGNLMPIKSADETADLMLQQLIEDLDVKEEDELLVILNGSGATTLMELFIIFRRVRQTLAKKNIKVIRNRIGEFLTTQEQAGFQMNITKLKAPSIDFWDSPCDAPYFVV
jgi:dihydroxyacetone kinase-like protein